MSLHTDALVLGTPGQEVVSAGSDTQGQRQDQSQEHSAESSQVPRQNGAAQGQGYAMGNYNAGGGGGTLGYGFMQQAGAGAFNGGGQGQQQQQQQGYSGGYGYPQFPGMNMVRDKQESSRCSCSAALGFRVLNQRPLLEGRGREFPLYPILVCNVDRVCFLPIHFGHQVRWTYQPGSHRRKVTQDFSSTFFLRCVP